jgi:hypothetical protein
MYIKPVHYDPVTAALTLSSRVISNPKGDGGGGKVQCGLVES